MTNAPGSDRTLLDRLNALKPSAVNLDPPSKTIAASTLEPAKPLSREDALSERLKSLRNQSSNNVHTTSDSGVGDGSSKNTTSSSSLQPQPQLNSKGLDMKINTPDVPSKEDKTSEVDDRLEELLFWETYDSEEEQAWIKELLAANGYRGPTYYEGSDDDSDGEYTTHKANEILAQAADEVDLQKNNEVLSWLDSTPTSKDTHQTHDEKPGETTTPKDTPPFNLPTVPSSLQDQPTLPPLSPSQADDPSSPSDADFAASINTRMAALRLATPPRTLPSAPTTAVDAFGLPTAPTFAPADRPVPGLIKRHGYTDADQKTWCTVCLEDGTVRCLGCDGDVYCARCWREMHVGPSAGYDERGHRWEKFNRDGKTG
ncbi:uncharacterized protein GGS22DRAFT_48953 [Annulohypoxylon maeteangense]|uniref:uncharacterized protein n=1 Tax=Annulohypoxylon maeteangense TaxID=1927788 RepID=UPI002007729D|nr:uncharacterized protein GGS22DRAFT_48953 [Annulohypoxylon maeteangense]KAI0882195.1 hypothetical protein GGS22DRAFT_48953 [Annulohypoxylon maeteangense]